MITNEKERERDRVRKRGGGGVPKIMKWMQIKSGRAELPMKIFIIPQTFGYRRDWN